MSLKIKVNSQDHIEGLADAPIELVEYGDYECAYCGKSYPVVKALQKKWGAKLKFVFRNFPLADLHPHALHAATAAEVAADLGKFWEMHDIIYENQRALTDDDLVSYAERVGIDAAQFIQKFSDSKYGDKIEADLEGGLRSGVNGTPSFYVNGKKYEDDPYSVEAFDDYFNSLSR